MKKETVVQVKKLLETPKKIVLVGHKNPDGDAVGSCVALHLFLKEKGHDSVVILPNDFPDFLKSTKALLISSKVAIPPPIDVKSK